MKDTIKESDWKHLSRIQPAALERLCGRIIEELQALAADPKRSHHERYGAIYEWIRKRDKSIAAAFDALSRSSALPKLATMRGLDLLTEDEWMGFSAETRESVELLIRIRRG